MSFIFFTNIDSARCEELPHHSMSFTFFTNIDSARCEELPHHSMSFTFFTNIDSARCEEHHSMSFTAFTTCAQGAKTHERSIEHCEAELSASWMCIR